ncbi:hypothetical protein OIU78_018504 [Salix suchowensis]|nr:hypothetical protein OIU78_018504 [Salix suchowensis]
MYMVLICSKFDSYVCIYNCMIYFS